MTRPILNNLNSESLIEIGSWVIESFTNTYCMVYRFLQGGAIVRRTLIAQVHLLILEA